MSINLNHLFILKTNISSEAARHSLKSVLDGNDQILQWNIDLHDIDCVLRVVSPTLCYEQIIQLINQLGFEGAELE